jgi:mannose-1-phosphate guanylyltransferase
MWVVVLAAGWGRRLQPLTTDPSGRVVPKQFCSFRGWRPLLRVALERAWSVSVPTRTLTVVSAQQRFWWQRLLADLPEQTVVEEPRQRGTAIGLLLPLLMIRARDPDAVVVVMPADHWVEDEHAWLETLRDAAELSTPGTPAVVLIGAPPTDADPGYGWIEPGGEEGGGPLRQVAAFHEKPSAADARRLLESGALWSTFIQVAPAELLLRLYFEALPQLTRDMVLTFATGARGWVESTLPKLYERLPWSDLSRDLLARAPHALRVLPAQACGWTDLGTIERVSACRDRTAHLLPCTDDVAQRLRAPVDLARSVARVERGEPSMAYSEIPVMETFVTAQGS